MSKILLISDLHLTSKPQDSYRWGIFKQVEDLHKQFGFDKLYCCGDITDLKKGHESLLVNRIVEGFATLASRAEVVILMGNHDLSCEGLPFFEFLKTVPNVSYVKDVIQISNHLFLPHTRDPLKDWEGLDLRGKIVFAHVSVEGAVYENGTPGSGEIKPEFFNDAILAFSGDIHSYQKIGPLTYIGCPFRVHFGDKFQGGAILLDDITLEWKRIPLDFLNRWTFDITNEEDLYVQLGTTCSPNDQIKIRLHLDQVNMGNWRQIKQKCLQLCQEFKVEACSFELINAFKVVKPLIDKGSKSFTDFEGYCQANKIDGRLVELGRNLLQGIN